MEREKREVVMLVVGADMIFAAQKLFIECDRFIEKCEALGISNEEAEAFKDKWLNRTYTQGNMIKECAKQGKSPKETLDYVRENDPYER